MSIFPGIAMMDFLPTITPLAPMTISAVTINFARYGISGNLCFFYIDFIGTLGGAASIRIDASLPLTVPTGLAYPAVASIVNTGATIGRAGTLSPNLCAVLKNNGVGDVNYILGFVRIVVEGFYQF